MDKTREKSSLIDSINEIKKVTIISDASPFLRSFSLNSSGDQTSAVKRKLDDSELDGPIFKKESRLGSPLMSPWEFRKLRADLIDAQSQIVRLEDRIDQLHKKNKESVIFFDQEKSEMKTQLESNRRTIQMLENKVQRMRTREKEAIEELTELKKINNSERTDRDERLLRLENENEELRLRVDELSGEGNEEFKELKTEADDLNVALQRAELEIDEKDALVETLNAKLAVALEDCREMEELKLELQLAQDKNKELTRDREELEEGRTMATILQDRVLRLNDIEVELKEKTIEIENLRLAVENKVLLEEKVDSLELKLSLTRNLEEEFISLKEKNFDLEKDLEKWVTLAEGFGKVATREALQRYVTGLGEKLIANELEMNSLRGEMESALAKLKSVTEQLNAAKAFETELKESMEKQGVEMKLLRRKVALVGRERDSYRQQLDMYEKDLTVCGKPSGYESAQQERVQSLEGTVEEYRKLLASLEGQLKEYQNDDAEARMEKTRLLQEELNSVREKLDLVSKRRDQLEELLESRTRSGECLTPGTRVLHLRSNPFTVADEQMKEDAEALRRECETLKARIQILESGDRLDLTMKAAAQVESGQAVRIKELEEELKSTALKNKRLKEVFKKTSQEFRDVSYMLLGYRIDLTQNKVYRLTNMYSEDPNDHLMFQLNRAGMMEMLETPFTESLSELVNEHLHRRKSIPCFLSAVSLYLNEGAESESPGEEEEYEEDEDDPEEVEISD